MSNTKFVAIGVACALLSAGAAQAQWRGPSWYASTTLTAQDRDIMRSTLQSDIHGKPIKTAAQWSNPASGHSGTVTLLSKSVRKGLPCERIDYRIASSKTGEQSQHYVFDSCRLPDGTWKLAD